MLIALETLADQEIMSHVIDLESKITVNNVIVKFWCTGWRIAQRYSQPKRFYPWRPLSRDASSSLFIYNNINQTVFVLPLHEIQRIRGI